MKQFFRDRLGQEEAVTLREGTVRIDERLVDYVDVERFAALSRVGEQMWQQDRELALGMFEEACQLAEEELVPEIAYADWLNEWREFVRERRCAMLGRLAEAAAAAGQDSLAEAYAAEWVRVRPLAEEARQMLIRVLAQAGRQAEAKRRYEEWERICRSELGVPPLAETRKLASGSLRT